MDLKKINYKVIISFSLISLLAACHSASFIDNIQEEDVVILGKKEDWNFKISSRTHVYNVLCDYCDSSYLILSNEVEKAPIRCLWCNRKVKTIKYKFVPFSYKSRGEVQLLLCPDDFEYSELANPWYSGDIPELPPEGIEPALKSVMEGKSRLIKTDNGYIILPE
jgi:hypothetical protein